MLATLIVIFSPKVKTNIPKSNTIGEVNPKVCPYDNQLKKETLDAKEPKRPPITSPHNNTTNKIHIFFLELAVDAMI